MHHNKIKVLICLSLILGNIFPMTACNKNKTPDIVIPETTSSPETEPPTLPDESEEDKTIILETENIEEDTKDNKYLIPEKNTVKLSECEKVVDSFLNACKEGNVNNIIGYCDSSYYLKTWTENKPELSRLLKYFMSDMEWAMNLDDMEIQNKKILDDYTLERDGIMDFQIVITYRPWKYAKEAYLCSHTNESEFSVPMESDIETMYGYLDSAKESLPLMFMNKISLIYTNDGVKIKADDFFSNFFRDTNIFSNSLHTNKYISYLLGGKEDIYITPTLTSFNEKARDSAIEPIKNITNMIREKRDSEVLQYITTLTNHDLHSMKEAIQNNSSCSAISSLKEEELAILNRYLTENTRQYEYDIQIKDSEVRQASIIRYYNLPAEFDVKASHGLLNFVTARNAYYHMYQYFPDDFNISKVTDSLKVLCDIYDDIMGYRIVVGDAGFGEVPALEIDSDPQSGEEKTTGEKDENDEEEDELKENTETDSDPDDEDHTSDKPDDKQNSDKKEMSEKESETHKEESHE